MRWRWTFVAHFGCLAADTASCAWEIPCLVTCNPFLAAGAWQSLRLRLRQSDKSSLPQATPHHVRFGSQWPQKRTVCLATLSVLDGYGLSFQGQQFNGWHPSWSCLWCKWQGWCTSLSGHNDVILDHCRVGVWGIVLNSALPNLIFYLPGDFVSYLMSFNVVSFAMHVSRN